MSIDDFKSLLTELTFFKNQTVTAPKDLESFEALVQAFKSSYKKEDKSTASAAAKADNRDGKGGGPQEGADAANANKDEKKPAAALPAGGEPPVLISIARLKQQCGVTGEP